MKATPLLLATFVFLTACGGAVASTPPGAASDGGGADAPQSAADAAASGETADDGSIAEFCNGGCLCYSVDKCPWGCYVSQTKQVDGSTSQPFCSNGIAMCSFVGGSAWSFGGPMNNCPQINPPADMPGPIISYSPVNLDGGPDGAFCCELDDQDGSIVDAAADTDTDAGGSDITDAGAFPGCHWPASLDDAGPGACHVARASLDCTYPSGAGCDCLSDDPTTCSGCGPATGAMCQDRCASNEYAMACGGPPIPTADGGFDTSYQQAPSTCRFVFAVPSGTEYLCCPCE